VETVVVGGPIVDKASEWKAMFKSRQSTGKSLEKSMSTKRSVERRSFMKNGLLAGSAATVGGGLLANSTSAQERGRLNPGDAAILQFLAAAELIESEQRYAMNAIHCIGFDVHEKTISYWARRFFPLGAPAALVHYAAF
jgi:hypothetical protein